MAGSPEEPEPMHCQQNVIVVTGGPGGGKTTALDLFQRELKAAVKIVPEAATLLFSHGLDREAGNEDGKLLQRSIYRMQISLEGIFRQFYADRLLICDRGTLDGLAYWPDDERSYLDSVGTTFEAEVARYGAVIFFQTAAIHGEDVKSNNPYRTEDSRTAVALDERLQRVWSRHPNFHFIPTELSFVAKINHGLKTIAGVLKQMPTHHADGFPSSPMSSGTKTAEGSSSRQ
jgi:predicted ATPase